MTSPMNAMNENLTSEKRWTFSDIDAFNKELAGCSAEEIIEWALQKFGSRLTIASSFGAEDVVLIDMAARIDPGVRVFTLDTGRLPEETYDVMNRIRQRYAIEFEVAIPDTARLEELLRTKGPYSFYNSVEDRRECCLVRKVEPLSRALSNVDAWVTGLRRAQSVTRSALETCELDLSNGGKLKISPLANWSEDDVWNHVRQNNVPFNALHEMGYPSIGCGPCTRAVKPGEDVRAGRWWWERPDDKECGLHSHEHVD